MKKYYWALFIFFIFIYVMPRVFLPLDTAHANYAFQAYEVFKSGSCNLATFELYLNGSIINLFGFNNFSLAFFDIFSVIALGLFLIFAIKKCTNDMVVALFSLLLFISSFWIFSVFGALYSVNESFSSWGALINFLGLGSYFMASRENKFSIQRIGLLILCGILTFASLRISGLNPFFLSICIATVYMLLEKRYLDMVLMPIIIIVTTLLLLILQSYYISGDLFGLTERYYQSVITYCHQISNNLGAFSATIRNNIITLILGLAPIAVFVICSFVDFKKNYNEFMKRPIYKFSIVFLWIGVIFTILTNALTLDFGMLPITYIPFSFLTATGLVYYFRSHNEHKVLNISLIIVALLAVASGIILLDFDAIAPTNNLIAYSLLIAGVLNIISCKMDLHLKIAIYFISFIVIILSFIPHHANCDFSTPQEVQEIIDSAKKIGS